MNKKAVIYFMLLLAVSAKAQQKVIPLYDGPAPGSESWTWTETENADNMYHAHTIFNISKPTLTVYLPDSTVAATGTAVIVCPGGGFHSLSIMQEGYEAVKWFQKRGITAFLLKYRLMHTLGTDPYKQEIDDRTNTARDNDRSTAMAMAEADAKQAIIYVRRHAAEYHITPNQIGIVGFSAGGYLAAESAYNYTPETRPDFAVPVYAYFPAVAASTVPADAPPLFIAAATNDAGQLNLHATALYNSWVESKHSAELHLYSLGGHGFGMNKQNLPSDTWTDRLADWMTLQGLLKPLSNEKPKAQVAAENWANFQKYVENRIHTDWAWLSKYDDANAKLPPPAPGEKRVVFMGNSITENWGSWDPDFFKNNGYICRGIGGQTSPQMLVRFREDVINLKPLAVVIETGTNDIAQNTGPMTLQNIFGNIVSMAELAKANGIKAILASVLPATKFSWKPDLQPANDIIKLNAMIKAYAAAHHLVYVDYWSAMVNDQKGLKVDLAQDGLVHPNMAGYKVMEPLVKKGIEATLKRK